ncbi:MAG: hypothetical protein VKJ06_07240 [Vampirovibrionales bacterium]|nr:hypothetical protein [Vampirovibrionales bacterium]
MWPSLATPKTLQPARVLPVHDPNRSVTYLAKLLNNKNSAINVKYLADTGEFVSGRILQGGVRKTTDNLGKTVIKITVYPNEKKRKPGYFEFYKISDAYPLIRMGSTRKRFSVGSYQHFNALG